MKIQAISRSIQAHQPAGAEVSKVPRNLDPSLHPFERAREYTRALNAVKLERLFAAPFVAQMGHGHVEGVFQMAKDPKSLERFASGSADGIVKVWDLPGRNEVWHAKAHDNIVRGMTWTLDQKLLTCAADRTIKLFDPYQTGAGKNKPVASWLGDGAFSSLSHHRSRHAFAAAASSVVSIYDLERHSAAPEVLRWPTSVDTITAVAFSPVETSVLASCAKDRALVLYDVRTSSALAKMVMTFSCNAIAWSPMAAFLLAVACDNHDVSILDTRRLDRAVNVLKGHVASVMDVEWSPTGEELVTGSWDRTVRLWTREHGHSRDVYHTKRMQRVFAARWTPDARYVLSGSDDGNVRLWRAQASRREGLRSSRHNQALEYNDALLDRYGHLPEIRRIRRHRHLPKVVKKAADIKALEVQSLRRREENRRKHGQAKTKQRRSEREKMVLAQEQ